MLYLGGQSLGLRYQETDPLATIPHLRHQQSLCLASAVACGPGTYFSGDPGQCVPCAPGSYQDGDGQLSCTPCPSSEGLGLAGARNVSECGGECGSPLEGGAGWGGGGSGGIFPSLPRSPKQRPSSW